MCTPVRSTAIARVLLGLSIGLTFVSAAAQEAFRAGSQGAPASADSPASEPGPQTRGAAFEAALRERLAARIHTSGERGTQHLFAAVLQLDAIAARDRLDGDEQGTLLVSAVPFGEAASTRRASIRSSQFDWVSRTPLQTIGPLWTRVEANLFAPDGATRPQLTQAYLRWGETLWLGKTYSTFMDDAALPATLDYNGPSGVSFVRQWLARVSVPLGGPVHADLAVEQAQADTSQGGDVAGTAVQVHTSAARPDLAARIRVEGERAHLQLAGVSRRIDVDAELGPSGVPPLATTSRRIAGRGVSLSGSVPGFGEDTLSGQWVRGDGIARYFNDGVSATGVTLGTDLRPITPTLVGTTLYYRRMWGGGLSSTFGASRLELDDGALLRPASALRTLTYASANLVWRAAPTVAVGGELQWGEARNEAGERASTLRAQVTVRWLVF